MKQLGQIYQGEPVNFEMVYNRYLKFTKTSSTEESPREVVLKAFEHLQVKNRILLQITYYAKTADQQD
jgi:origin recognition complex subunit 4